MTPFCFFPILAGFGSCAKLYGNSGSCRMNRWGTVDFSNHPDETANSQALKQSFPIRFGVWGRWFSLNFPFCLLEKCGYFFAFVFWGPLFGAYAFEGVLLDLLDVSFRECAATAFLWYRLCQPSADELRLFPILLPFDGQWTPLSPIRRFGTGGWVLGGSCDLVTSCKLGHQL